jgi:hypothetical protein
VLRVPFEGSALLTGGLGGSMGSMGSPNAVNFGGLAWPKTSEEIGKPMENPEFFFFERIH